MLRSVIVAAALPLRSPLLTPLSHSSPLGSNPLIATCIVTHGMHCKTMSCIISVAVSDLLIWSMFTLARSDRHDAASSVTSTNMPLRCGCRRADAIGNHRPHRWVSPSLRMLLCINVAGRRSSVSICCDRRHRIKEA